jgi:hypothetical protein
MRISPNQSAVAAQKVSIWLFGNLVAEKRCPYMGVVFKKQGESKEQARIKQTSSKDDFSQNHAFWLFFTPKYGV